MESPNYQPVSESFGNLPQPSEQFGDLPHGAEAFGNIRHVRGRQENHTLTVKAVLRRFESAGVTRTERSIVNWCQPNRTGIARLDAYYDPNERRYFITPESVDRAIEEERSRVQRTDEPAASPQEPDTKARRSEPAADSGDLSLRLRDLEIATRVKDMAIEQLKQELARNDSERRGYVQQLIDGSRRLGELESTVRQLSEPERPRRLTVRSASAGQQVEASSDGVEPAVDGGSQLSLI